MAENSHRYLFQQFDPFVYQFLMSFEEALTFSGHVPIINTRGELMISGLSSYVFNGQSAPEVQALAWDFIRFLQNPAHYEPNPETEWFPFISMVPLYRPLMRSGLEQNLPGWAEYFEEEFGWRLAITPEDTVEYVYNLITEIGQMPMADSQYTNNAVSAIIWEVIEQFHDGLMTAEQAAADLQNRVTLALMEL